MGFRNPVTTVAAVDTANGRAGAPGVRVYGQEISPDSGIFQGIVDWFDGVATARASLTGGGVGDSGGNVFEVRGGSALGVTAPGLQLNVEGLPAGGYGPVARLKGAGLVIDSPGTRVQGLQPLLGTAGVANVYTNGSGQFTITHNIGATPTAFLVASGGGGVIPNLVDFVVTAVSATTATVTAIRRDNNTAFANNPVSCEWTALQPAP